MEQPAPTPKTLRVNLDYRLIAAALLVIIALMFVIWKPWSSAPGAKDRTVSVTGSATLTAEPDEFVFNPSYQYTIEDKDTALKQLSDKSDEVVAGLKKLGVKSSKIKTNANSWAYPAYNDDVPTYTLNITVTVNDSKLVQKVQDYLLGTSPTGSLTPQASFSTDKRKELERTARDKATKEARNKADQSAKNLGFKVGAVKSIDDGSGFGSPVYPLSANASSLEGADAKSSLTVQPGENTLDYSVTVVYYIK